jgi:L-ribulose-5-phosphate 3-epimerase UlaE
MVVGIKLSVDEARERLQALDYELVGPAEVLDHLGRTGMLCDTLP